MTIGPKHEVMAKLGCLTWADARAIVAALDFTYGDDDGTTTWGSLRATDAERRRGKQLWRELTSARRRAQP
jgi:hypothetical protein